MSMLTSEVVGGGGGSHENPDLVLYPAWPQIQASYPFEGVDEDPEEEEDDEDVLLAVAP